MPSVLSVMAGLIVEMLFMLFSVYNTVQLAESELIRSIPVNIFFTNNLLEIRVPKINYGDLSKKQTSKYKEKLVILQSIGIVVIKSKETRVITYTCRYSGGHLIPIIQSCQGLEYLHV